MRVLVVEDEVKMVGYLSRALIEAGYSVDDARDGNEALHRAKAGGYDAIVLDLNLPQRDGLSVLRELRASGQPTPILILSARDQVEDRITGLTLGADDYLTKPFSMSELLTRVSTLLKRTASGQTNILHAGDLELDRAKRTVRRAGQPIDLPTREYGLLEFLLQSAGRTLTRTQILEHVWGYHFDPGTNVVDVYIKRLRRKIDDDHDRKLIHTVAGVGYRLGLES